MLKMNWQIAEQSYLEKYQSLNLKTFGKFGSLSPNVSRMLGYLKQDGT